MDYNLDLHRHATRSSPGAQDLTVIKVDLWPQCIELYTIPCMLALVHKVHMLAAGNTLAGAWVHSTVITLLTSYASLAWRNMHTLLGINLFGVASLENGRPHYYRGSVTQRRWLGLSVYTIWPTELSIFSSQQLL